jgi:hypothetical protein
MEYFRSQYSMNLLKNYIFKDQICDWYEIQHYKYKNYQKDSPTKYKDFIIKESNEYKHKVFNYICDQLGLPSIFPKLSVKNTKQCIQRQENVIFQGSLYHSKYNLVVPCDIIIDYQSFQNVFPEIHNIPEMNPDDYLLIQVSYSSLHFRKDKMNLQNDEMILYKKCSLLCFYECFQELVTKPIYSFILGKEYYYQKELLPKSTYIGNVSFPSEMKDIIDRAIQWLHLVTTQYDSMNILPEPTHNELYPNMNYKESDWEQEKKNVANILREITLIWNISYRERCELLKKDISSWDNPKLLIYLKESKKKHIQERMIHMNQQKEVIVYPRKSISGSFKEQLQEKQHEYFFDIESFLSFDEKQDLIEKQLCRPEPVLGILGYIYNGTYKDFTIQSYGIEEEKHIIQRWYKHLMKDDTDVYLYHWGNAEKVYIDYIQKICPELDMSKIHLINILHYIKEEPILIQGIFSFGLKQIGKVLYDHGFIQTTWKDKDNGLDSMIEFKELCINHHKQIPLKRISEIQQIIDYNRVDCQVLYEIVLFLRKRYL